MARISKQPIKREDGNENLTPRFVVVVEVVSFTCRFATVAQLRECIAYYETNRKSDLRAIHEDHFRADVRKSASDMEKETLRQVAGSWGSFRGQPVFGPRKFFRSTSKAD